MLAPGLIDGCDRVTVEMVLRMRFGLPGSGGEGDLESLRGGWLDCTTLSMPEAWTAGGIAASARDVARFLGGLFGGALLGADGLARMTDCTEDLGGGWSRGIGLIDLGAETYGQHGAVPGYTTVVVRRGGRSIVVCQNGIEIGNELRMLNPFVAAALDRP